MSQAEIADFTGEYGLALLQAQEVENLVGQAVGCAVARSREPHVDQEGVRRIFEEWQCQALGPCLKKARALGVFDESLLGDLDRFRRERNWAAHEGMLEFNLSGSRSDRSGVLGRLKAWEKGSRMLSVRVLDAMRLAVEEHLDLPYRTIPLAKLVERRLALRKNGRATAT